MTTPIHEFPSDLSWKIFLDRYTQKDPHRAFVPGDLAIAVITPDPKWPKKDIGRVLTVDGETLTLELLTGPQAGETLTRSRTDCDRPLEQTLTEVAERIGRGIAQVEAPDRQAAIAHQFTEEIAALRWVPGGRIWAAAGTEQELTYFNCYVIPNPQDSREGIVETLGQMIEIMSRGGGVGINVSSLRPAHAVVQGVNGRSSGAVSWMDLYSRATGLVEQGGCFAPEVRIATTQGLIPAHTLFERIGYGESFDALTHEGAQPITARFSNGTQQLWRVTSARGYSLEVTESHKMGVLRDGQILTIPLAELHVGDEVLTLLGDGIPDHPVPLQPLVYTKPKMSTTLNEHVILPEFLDESLAYLIGYLFGNGTLLTGKKTHWQAIKGFSLSVPDARPEIREQLIQSLRTLFGIEPSQSPGTGAVHNILVYSRLMVEWLQLNGLLKTRAESIRLPELFFHTGASLTGAFVAGYFDADGCNRGSKGGFGFDSVSLPMLQDLQQCLAAFGIASHLRSTDRTPSAWRTIHRLLVTGAEFKKRFQTFAKLSFKVIGPVGQRNHGHHYPRTVWTHAHLPSAYYQGTWDSTKPRISYRALSQARNRAQSNVDTASVAVLDRLLHVLPDRIISILPTRRAPVYDFEVQNTHLLSGNGFYTSNSRRGALMLQLEDWHPDLPKFIAVKQTPGMVENANISVRVSDDFMAAVKADADWDLVFPDTHDPDYDTLWDGNLETWKAAGKPVIVYETVKARNLWDALIQGAWAAAEPGIVFDQRHESESNSWYFNPLVCTNPCAEQPLPAWGVCTLGHVNLAQFVDADRQDVDWNALRHTVQTGIRFLDNVVDATPYFYEENRANQQRERRIGLGTMGLGELLIRLGYRYGSPESLAFIDGLFGFIAQEAYLYDTVLAKEKGTFPAFDAEKLLQSGFMQRLPETVRDAIRQHGLRNVTLLTQAPTGTVGTMVGTSTGIEPFYALTYFRQSRLGFDQQYVDVAREWLDTHPGESLPNYFVGAMDLTPEEHVQVQAAIQVWTDSSISKTANAPSTYTVEDTARLYELAYDLGCKGVTIYRDQSRQEQVLHLTSDADESTEPSVVPLDNVSDPTSLAILPVPSTITGTTYRKETPAGTARVVINTADGSPFEVFLLLGRAGSEVQSFMEALGRIISLHLRTPGPVPATQRLAHIADQLRGIGGANQMGFGPQRVLSVVDAIGQVLQHAQSTESPADRESAVDPSPSDTTLAVTADQPPSHSTVYDLCPQCSALSLVYEEGCQHCVACGYSKC